METILYFSETLLRKLTIKREGYKLTFYRENISGVQEKVVGLSNISHIEVKKEFMSYTLTFVGKDEEEKIVIDRLSKEAVQSLEEALGEEFKFIKIERKQDVTIEDARKDGKEILKKLEEDFDTNIFISYLLNYAASLKVSDIHINPMKKGARIQFRIDNLLTDILEVSQDIYVRMLVGLKNVARLSAQIATIPQEGTFHFHEDNFRAYVRCSTVPTMFGEKVDIRILNTDRPPLFLEDLGFSPETLTLYKALITQPQGCIVLSGPSGGGKSTTIYASLISLFDLYERTVNIATIEDPVDYIIEDFQQTQLKRGSNLTYATVLKSLLNLNPDIILVGEIRDRETADAVVRAALSGHLIFTTILARNAIGVFSALREMGSDVQMVSSAVNGVLYQDLIRKLCPHCKQKADPPEEFLEEIEERGIQLDTYYTSSGCPHCDYRGYLGLTGIFELLLVDDDFRELIVKGASQKELAKYQKDLGMKFLWDDALEKVSLGITDYREIKRVCPKPIIPSWKDFLLKQKRKTKPIPKKDVKTYPTHNTIIAW